MIGMRFSTAGHDGEDVREGLPTSRHKAVFIAGRYWSSAAAASSTVAVITPTPTEYPITAETS